MPEPSSGALAAGQIFHGRYEIVRCLKAGGMGAVYECIHLGTRKHRALKVMLPQIVAQAEMRARFELEARVTADVESEHIVETFDAGVDDATSAPFLVMELLRGEDLATLLRRRGALSVSDTLLLLSQAALALDKTHAAGIVHRDLKPDNLFVTARDDGSPRLKILDFGIAKVIADITSNHPGNQHTAMVGTPLYMPPEQIRGEPTIGPRTDLYALGHITFTLLTGQAYWSDEKKATGALYTFLQRVVQGGTEPATARAARRGVALPAAFDAWFARATARSPDERFESASTQVHELEAVLNGAGPQPLAERASLSPPGSSLILSPPAGVPAPAGARARTGGHTTMGSASSHPGGPARRSTLRLVLVAVIVSAFAALGLHAALRAPRGGPRTRPPGPPRSRRHPLQRGRRARRRHPRPPLRPLHRSAWCRPRQRQRCPACQPGRSSESCRRARRRQAAAPLEPPASDPCKTPYVLDSAGIRRMKPQCL